MPIPQKMTAVLLNGHGGFEQLDYRHDVPVPTPEVNQVLIQVHACGVNNTDINTRTAWYSKSVTTGTNDGAIKGFATAKDADGSWAGQAINFPIIQGADCCGEIVAVGANVQKTRIGERVLVRTMQLNQQTKQRFDCLTYGSEMSGGFAQFALAHTAEAYAINSDWSATELASVPCAYSTAEGMLHRAAVGAETVLITGASGGVGSAAIQLAKRRGARVIALAAAAKQQQVLAFGAHRVFDRNADLVQQLGAESVDVVIDLVAGEGFAGLLEVLKRGGRYATAGAIAGPLVQLDVRTLYLKDLTFYGCTFQDEVVFSNLIGYIERNEIRPLLAKTYPLAEIVQAQRDFLAKQYAGKLVLLPPKVLS